MVPTTSLNQDASTIFTVVNGFLRDGGRRRKRISSALESFPQSMVSIPWRRVYKPLEAQSVSYLIMGRWEASELSFGGAGTLWCFTELPRCGENVSRKTEDGQTWLSKSGRSPKNGFPDQILVDKLVISGKAFHMLELTLDHKKPIVALCKIWRNKGDNVAAASSQDTNANLLTPGALTSQQVQDAHIQEGTEMEIDQPQGQLGSISQHHMPDNALSMSGYIMVPDPTEGCIPSTGQDDCSIYQESVSFLHKMKGSFKQVALSRRDDAHKIASLVQSAALILRNVASNRLGINGEPESTWPNTSNGTGLMGEASSGANPVAIYPEMITQMDEFIDQGLAQLMEHCIDDNFFDVGDFLNSDGRNGAS